MPSPRDDDGFFKPVDPYALARNQARAGELKRFFGEARIRATDAGHVLMLDEREARTPARRPISLPRRDAAARLAAEWNAQGDVIEPAGMPLTRLVNAVIDGVAHEMGPVKAEIVKYAGTDLLCYRAEEPPALVAREAQAWDPVLAWARDALGADLHPAQGLMHRVQPPAAIRAVDRAVDQGVGLGPEAPFRLGALHVMTTLTGSALLALAVLHGALDDETAWEKAHVDEDFQTARWGEDAEAVARRARRWREMQAAAILVNDLPR